MKKILEIKFGSHLYGTNNEKSDLDFKGIYLPSAKEIVLGNYKKTISTCRPKKEFERNNKDDIDIEIFSLDRFLELLLDGQTVALDMLFAPEELYTHYTEEGLAIIRKIYDNKEKLLNKNVNAFLGYARMQAARYGIKGSRMDALERTVKLLDTLPQNEKLWFYAEDLQGLVDECKEFVSLEKAPLVEITFLPGPNKVDMMPHLHVCGRKVPFQATVKFARDLYGKILNGYGLRAHKSHLSGGRDYKALSHAVRVNAEAKELLSTGHITFPRPERELLRAIKEERVPFEQVAELIERGLAEVVEISERSSLRDVPDRQWAIDFIYEIYSEIVKKG